MDVSPCRQRELQNEISIVPPFQASTFPSFQVSTVPLVQVSTAPQVFSDFDEGRIGRPRKICRPVQLERIGTWNVEGLLGASRTKLFELYRVMKLEGISILCIQETHLLDAEHFKEEGFSVFLSGASNEGQRSYAGVGFLVAPWAIKSIISFKAVSDRIASLRVKVVGGILNLLSVYAPHDKYDFEVRHNFYTELSMHTKKPNSHETSLVFGDFNTQMGCAGCDEMNFLGPFMYNKLLHEKRNGLTNRPLFSEYCGTHDFVVANTLFEYADEFLVTYHNLTSQPLETVVPWKFSQIDFVLCAKQNTDMVDDCWTDRSISLRSHHFLMIASVRIEFPKQGTKYDARRNIQSIRNENRSHIFYSAFTEHLQTPATNSSINLHAQQVTEAFQHAASTLPQYEVLPNKPWISEGTLGLISQKNMARR